jgi:glycosyltransferase involved in cell wall biosynthesis
MKIIPKVSVIVPFYNNAITANNSLKSLFSQDLIDIEIIAVNDGSADDTRHVLDNIATNEARLKVIHLTDNVGVHEARATGLRLSHASYIGFLDADDFAKPSMYRILLDACVRHDADIAICGIDRVSDNHQVLYNKICFNSDKIIHDNIFDDFCCMAYGTGSLCNKLYSRGILLKHASNSFRWRQDAGEDTLVNIGCFLDAKRISLVKDTLYEYVENSQSATQSINNAKAFMRMFRAYALALETYQHRGNSVIESITELYRRQLHYECYCIEELADLAEFHDLLAEAAKLIAELYPVGLAYLANCRKKQEQEYVTKSLTKIKKEFGILPRLLLKAVQRRLSPSH